MTDFAHLHVHTQYSILDGAANIPELIRKVKATGMKAIAITDHGNMFGVKEFHNEAKKQGIKPILGCEMYVAGNSRFKKDEKEDRAGFHLILLAKNMKGYKNLIKMVSLAWIEGFYYKPRIDKELLRKYSEGIIASSACLGGELPSVILNRKGEKAEEVVKEFVDIFGDDYYLELVRHETGDPEIDSDTFSRQVIVNKKLIELSEKFNIKLIATNDVHFINAEDAEAHDRLICLNTGKELDDPDRLRYTKQEFLKTPQEMSEIFSDIPEALENTVEVVEKIDDYELNHKPVMPDFSIPEGFEDEDDYLRFLSFEGAKTRYDNITAEIKERIDFELSVIKKMGYPGYFLIVQDFLNAAREMDVSIGPGRGSAAGSVVSYCTGITDIDPLKYNLLFERFLNPDRVSMPDIDIDFDEDGRDQVLKWVVEKYGQEYVAHIITFGTMAAKMAIRDVGRIQKLPLAEADRLAKLVPERPGTTLKLAYSEVPELRAERTSGSELVSQTLKFAEILEGSVRHTGLHACGIIIGKNKLIEHLPISTSKESSLLVTQFDGSHVEDVGMLKM
ncbi:MAG: DNA polymerase III subunit alpha, partial [Bacteroidales bacterium]|nr:DNA polymerase III subunit alpha [Bacteroidales bacterium]